MAACYATAPAVRAKAFLSRMGYVQTWRLSWYRRLRFQSLTNKVQTVWSTDAYNRYLYCTFQSLINKYLNSYALYTGQPVGAAVPTWCFLFFKRIICWVRIRRLTTKSCLLWATHVKLFAESIPAFAVSMGLTTFCRFSVVRSTSVSWSSSSPPHPPTHTPKHLDLVSSSYLYLHPWPLPCFLGLLTLLLKGDRHLYVDVDLLALSFVSLWSTRTFQHASRALSCHDIRE
jgi:hypothetical protein